MKGTVIKVLDIPVIILLLVLTLAAAAAVYRREASASRVTIRSVDKTWVFPLDAEERISVPGPLGETVVEIHARGAAIVSSPCGEKTCVAAGALRGNGRWAACLPNGVFLLVEGSAPGEVDAASF